MTFLQLLQKFARPGYNIAGGEALTLDRVVAVIVVLEFVPINMG